MIYSKSNESDIESLNLINPIGKDKWKGEFFSTMQPSYISVCKEENKFIGCEGYIGYYLIRNGLKVLTHRSERTIVNPNYRGHGIFKKLIETCDEWAISDDSHFSWGATAALKPFNRAGFDMYQGFRNYSFYPIRRNFFSKIFSKYLNPFVVFKSLRKKNINELKSMLSFFSLFKPSFQKNKQLELIEYKYQDVKNLIENLQDDIYRIDPNDQLLNWLSDKGLNFEKRGIVFEGKLVGYVIIRLNDVGNYCSIVDIYFDHNQIQLTDILDAISRMEELKRFDCIFLALNALNKDHLNWITNLKKSKVLNFTRAGSFVLKPLTKQVKLNELALTDIWLEL